VAPLPTNRILMVDVRNLDAPEEQLVRATDVTIARVAPGHNGDVPLDTAVAELAAGVDYIYLHIDSDILDITYVPNHNTGEPHGPDLNQVLTAVDTVMATGKVAALALVSVYGAGEGHEISVDSGIQLLYGSLTSWQKYGSS
jgi:arginase